MSVGGPVKFGKMSTTASDAEIISAYQDNLIYNYFVYAALSMLEYLPTIVIAMFSALRVFALLGRTYILATFTFALGLAPAVLNLYQTSQITYYYIDDPVLGASCYFNYLISPSVLFYGKNHSGHIIIVLTHSTATLAGTLSTICADVIAIVVTWIKTYRHVREASSTGADISFGAVLLRYGSLYFILPNIIISRFLINLHQINAHESGSAANFSRFSPLNFHIPSIPSIVGNLGEPLADNEDDRDDEDRIVAEAYGDGTAGAAVNSAEEVGMSDVMDIGSGGIEVLAESV
ncbi:hypothetical protein NM688_g4554 [Phlebia brevispora]|uniref:Uncharacterized protein n=1 Tax=Phlebia brevispora TaxID=194682 RepID=A0ACC1T2Q9_9APHY|nr:hypothetical protein NM688_g4554 [Phlebia brevispora]